MKHERIAALAFVFATLFAAPSFAQGTDSDSDGFPDSWEQPGVYVNGVSLYNRGCRANKADVLLHLTPNADVDLTVLRAEMEKVKQLYADLETPNPDGTTGIRMWYSIGRTLDTDDAGKDWDDVRDEYLPASYKGIFHWMQIQRGGGGNADLGDGGLAGDHFLKIAHEFGHELGLDHHGGYQPFWSPLYPSLMNYTYNYQLNGSESDADYSRGRFVGYTIRETALSEQLPFPAGQLGYLKSEPYYYSVISTGPNSSAIDWNRNGNFDTGSVRADVNWGYGTELGEKIRAGEAHSSPWLFTADVGRRLFVAYGYDSGGATVSPAHPAILRIRELNADGSSAGVFDAATNLRGDPVVAQFLGLYHVFYPANGVIERLIIDPIGRRTVSTHSFPSPSGFIPVDAGVYEGNFVVLLWNRITNEVRYSTSFDGVSFNTPRALTQSTVAPGFTVDGQGRFVLAKGANLGSGRESVIWVAYYNNLGSTGSLQSWYGGWGDQIIGEGTIPLPDGTTRNSPWREFKVGGRLSPYYDAGGRAGEPGKLLILGRKAGSETEMFVAQQVSDYRFSRGWIVKDVFNIWTQTRSSPSWVGYNGDIAVAFRWTGNEDHTNDLTVSFRGSGVESGEMGDRDDVTALRIGLIISLLYVRANNAISFTLSQ